MLSTLSQFVRNSSLAALALLAGCATSQPAKVSWEGVPNFGAPHLDGKKFAIDFKSAAAAPEFDFIAAHLRQVGTDRGMVFTRDSSAADFVVCVAVRYFDASPVADQGRTILAAGKKIEAIRRYRDRRPVGLKEAKVFVETLTERHGIAAPRGGCLGAVLGLMIALLAAVSVAMGG